jgi:hypothetical protein
MAEQQIDKTSQKENPHETFRKLADALQTPEAHADSVRRVRELIARDIETHERLLASSRVLAQRRFFPRVS